MSRLIDALAYGIGLLLIVMPAKSIPYLDGSNATVRMGKHLIGLILFAAGTIRIHQVIREDAGSTFIVASAILILIVSIFKTWRQKRD